MIDLNDFIDRRGQKASIARLKSKVFSFRIKKTEEKNTAFADAIAASRIKTVSRHTFKNYDETEYALPNTKFLAISQEIERQISLTQEKVINLPKTKKRHLTIIEVDNYSKYSKRVSAVIRYFNHRSSRNGD